MNNEPVAWMVDGVLFTSLGAALNISFDIEQPCIPLYTHPAKEELDTRSYLLGRYDSAKTLTDEEIKGVMALDECWIGEDCGMPNMIAFARAILRKASEK